MVQEGIDLAFVVKGAKVAAVVESNALLLPPPPPTGPLQQHGCERARLHPTHRERQTRSAGQRPPLPSLSPTILIGGGVANNVVRSLLSLPQLIE